MNAVDLLRKDESRLAYELQAVRDALAVLTRGRVAPKGNTRGVKVAAGDNRPSKRSIIAAALPKRGRPELDAVMARLAEHGYPTDAKARQAASNVASKLLKGKAKRK